MEFLTAKVAQLLLAAIPIGAISFALFQVVKRLSAQVDGIKSPYLKQAAVVLVATLVTAVFGAAGVNIDCVPGENCLALVSQDKLGELLKAALGAFTAFVLHALKNGRPSRRK